MNQLIWILLILHVTLMTAVNVNYVPYHVKTKSIIVFDRPLGDMEKNAYFGFSSGCYTSTNPSVVISAPRADQIGKLFDCHINDLSCSAMTIDPVMNSKSDVTTLYPNHHFWLGATVKGNDSNILACAPLSVERSKCPAPSKNFATYGKCYQYLPEADDSTLQKLDQILDSVRLDGFDDENERTIENCMDSFGWSIDISSHKKKVVVGGPAMATGRAMVYASTKDTPEPIINYKNVYNFGYSVAYGNFMSDHMLEHIAISAPYGEKGFGKVFLHPKNNLKESIISDPDNQVGSLFGGSLCAAKLNPTSSRAHLLVGAPAFAVNDATDRKLAYNCGAVHIYASSGRLTILKKLKSIKTTSDGALFGSAIANLGDLDGDKSEDVAIAAPFEDDGHGAVYIYLGSDLIRQDQPRYKQKIQPEKYRAFGLSLSTLQDYDKNGCNDSLSETGIGAILFLPRLSNQCNESVQKCVELVIGAPGSMQGGNDKVAVFRCFSCLNVNMLKIKFPDLKKRDDVTFFELSSCMEVTYPKNNNNVTTKLSMTVKIVHPSAILAQNNSTSAQYIIPISKTKTGEICPEIKVLTPVNGEYDTKISFNVKVDLTDSPLDKEGFDPAEVVLCSGSRLEMNDDVFAGNCFSDKCEPILEGKVISDFLNNKSYLIGSTELESFKVEVINIGDDVAYSTCVSISVVGVPVTGVPKLCEYDCDVRPTCQRVLCRPNVLLVSNSHWTIESILLGVSSLKSTDELITIDVKVFAHCSDEKEMSSDSRIVSLISFYEGVVINGTANPGNAVNVIQKEATTQGKHIEHLYTVTNTGPTNIVGITYKLSIQNTSYLQHSEPTVFKGLLPLGCKQEPVSVGDMIITTCEIDELSKSETVVFTLPIDLIAGKMDLILQGKNLTVDSQLELFLYSTAEIKWSASKNVTTTLTLYDPTVDWWIILLAIILGIILISLLLFLLYEGGCLRRQNKEKLQELKREVRRQSIRRSVRERDSMRSSASRKENGDETALVKDGENDIDIQEVRYDSFVGDHRSGKTVADVHIEPL